MATKKRVRSTADDERKGRARFVDQPGQWVNTNTPAFKKKRSEGLAKLAAEMKKGKKK